MIAKRQSDATCVCYCFHDKWNNTLKHFIGCGALLGYSSFKYLCKHLSTNKDSKSILNTIAFNG